MHAWQVLKVQMMNRGGFGVGVLQVSLQGCLASVANLLVPGHIKIYEPQFVLAGWPGAHSEAATGP